MSMLLQVRSQEQQNSFGRDRLIASIQPGINTGEMGLLCTWVQLRFEVGSTPGEVARTRVPRVSWKRFAFRGSNDDPSWYGGCRLLKSASLRLAYEGESG
jgi:hypothetical protein